MSKIEWTDKTINPIRARLGEHVGHHCVKVSPGCKHCYASTMQVRFGMPTYDAFPARGGVEHFLDAGRLEEVLRRKKPTKWFWCDMTDMFGEWVPDEWIAACFGVMAATPQHTHQVLTKRPARMAQWFEHLPHNHVGWCQAMAIAKTGLDPMRLVVPDSEWPLRNVWLGTSTENQEQADARIPELLQCDAALHFLSVEPLLGPIEFDGFLSGEYAPRDYGGAMAEESGPRLDWIILGGESGQKARPTDLRWIRAIIAQCAETGTACFHKQLGSLVRVPADEEIGDTTTGWSPFIKYRDDLEEDGAQEIRLPHSKGGRMDEWAHDLRVRQFPGEAS